MNKVTPYQMAINNVALFIASPENQKLVAVGDGLNGFTASYVLSIAFCKAKEEVCKDILEAHQKLKPKDLIRTELTNQRFPRDSKTIRFIDPVSDETYDALAKELGLTPEDPSGEGEIASWVLGINESILMERGYGISFVSAYLARVIAALRIHGFKI